MSVSFHNINKELNAIKKEIKLLKTKSNTIHIKDEIDSHLSDKIDEIFINNNSIIKLNMDILNLKMSVMNINNDISLFKERIKDKKAIILSKNFITFLHKNDFYNLHLFEKIGCKEIEDLLLLSEDELIDYGITIIDAKKLLKAAKKQIETNAFSINYV